MGLRAETMREKNDADNSMLSRVCESLMNYETIKYFKTETHEKDKFNQVFSSYSDLSKKEAKLLTKLQIA